MRNYYLSFIIKYFIFSTFFFSINVFAQSQTFPNKPIHFIVPFAPGGSTDVTARIIGQKLSELLKQAVIVEHRAGAGAVRQNDLGQRNRIDAGKRKPCRVSDR